jgi:hypothetical protein
MRTIEGLLAGWPMSSRAAPIVDVAARARIPHVA